jgi:fucose 4-O-acetylase-like acetyltransferase
MNGRVDINSFYYGINILLFYITGVTGIMSIIFISSFYNKENKIVTKISNETIIIMAFHGYMISIMSKICNPRKENWHIVSAVIFSVVIILTIVLFMEIMKKLFYHSKRLVIQSNKLI